MRDVKISLVGYGIVGHGVVEVLNRKKKMLREMGLNLKLISVTDHTGTVVSEGGAPGRFERCSTEQFPGTRRTCPAGPAGACGRGRSRCGARPRRRTGRLTG